MPRIRIIRKDHIAHVELTRAEKKNAMDDEMIDALIAAGASIDTCDTRAVILSGDGNCFCAGIDIAGLQKMAEHDIAALIEPRTHGQGTTNRWQEVVMAWHRLPCPVIAALHGAVYGAGLQLALGADIRIAAPDTSLAIMEMKWGLIPDMGGMVLLPRLLREDVLKRMLYTAAPVDARQALQLGLVTEVSEDPLASARDLARTIARQSPKAIRAAKQLTEIAFHASPDAVLRAEAAAQSSLLGQPEQREVVAARMEKRPSVFE